MSKNIVLFSDGTNNRGGMGRDTNVWRLYKMLDNDSKNIAFYDDGVGTERSTPIKILGLVFGYGLSRNVLDLYIYLASHYEEGDHIYLFGFSRGAFTVRLLANLIDFAGLPGGNDWKSKPLTLKKIAKESFEAYKQKVKKLKGNYSPEKLDDKRLCQINSGYQSVPIRCIGVWDTVNATGVPINEVRILLLRWWPYVQDKSIKHLPLCVKTGFHALAIDEARKTFSPTLWDEATLAADQYVEQVWFAGVHSNVGGGYPKDSLAQVSLEWMIGRLEMLQSLEKSKSDNHGLLFNAKRKNLREDADVHGKLYDSRAGLSAFHRYQPRDLSSLYKGKTGNEASLIHESVLQRIDNATNFYAPCLIKKFRVIENNQKKPHVTDTHTLNTEHLSGNSRIDILHLINSRVMLYWSFILLCLAIIVMPITDMKYNWANEGNEIGVLSQTIGGISFLLPDFLSPLVEWYVMHPLLFLGLLVILLLLRVAWKRSIENHLSIVASDMWKNLNENLLRRVMGDSTANVALDSAEKQSEVRELNVLEKSIFKMERAVSRKIDFRSDLLESENSSEK